MSSLKAQDRSTMDTIIGYCTDCTGNVIRRPWGSYTCYCLEDHETKTWRKEWERMIAAEPHTEEGREDDESMERLTRHGLERGPAYRRTVRA